MQQIVMAVINLKSLGNLAQQVSASRDFCTETRRLLRSTARRCEGGRD